METTTETKKVDNVNKDAAKPAAAQPERKRNFRTRRDGPRGRRERPKPEFDQKIVSIRRVTRVVRGGRRFSFSVGLVAGDKKGSVGVGIGKATDTALAIEKAVRHAKKNMITIKLTKKGSIAHDMQAKFSSSEVKLMTAPGKGIIAGSAARTVLELAGVREVGAKFISRSKNKVNNARATIKALSAIEGTIKKI